MGFPTQYVAGENEIDGAAGIALTVNVTGVAGPVQFPLFVSTTYTVRTTGATELKPNARLVGFSPVVSSTVRPASLNQLYVLPTTGVVITGGVIDSPTQNELGVNVTPGATGTALTVSVTEVATPSQPLAFFSVTKMVRTRGATLVKPNTALPGLVPVVRMVVRPASLYHV